jgi:hypothetical protein
VPAPRARNITYNAVGPISALGFRSPTLAQLMARFATTDPSLSSLAADRRQGLSLIAPPNAKRRRTCTFSDQSPATFSARTCQCPIHWYDLYCPLLRMNTGIYLLILHLQKKQWKNNLWTSQCLSKQVHPGLNYLSQWRSHLHQGLNHLLQKQ